MHLGICVPARDQVHTAFARSLCYLTNKLTEKQISFDLNIVCGSVIAESRTQLAKQALGNNSTHLLWLDSDIHFPPNVFEKLLSHNKHIVAANYSTRYLPQRSVAFTDPKNIDCRLEEKTGLHQVWAVGMGCMLTTAEVYNNLPKPWFSHEYNRELDNFGGEDIYFCNQAGYHGYDVWVDADIKTAHFGIKANTL